MVTIELDDLAYDTCHKAAMGRIEVTTDNFSYATIEANGGKLATQYKVEMCGALVEAAFAKWWNLKDEEWTYVGRRPGSTDFTINGYAVEVKGTYTPIARNPKLAIKPKGKRSDLYVLAHATPGNPTVTFLGWAKYSDFPTKAEILPGWRNPTLNIPADKLRAFRRKSS